MTLTTNPVLCTNILFFKYSYCYCAVTFSNGNVASLCLCERVWNTNGMVLDWEGLFGSCGGLRMKRIP